MQKRTNFRAFAVQAAVLVLIALVIGACAPVTVPTAAPAAAQPTAATQQPRKIAYVAWNMNNPWSVTLRDAIKAAVEANGDTLVESDPSGDPAKQIPQIETFIGQQVDGIILTPTSASAVIPAIEAADKAGIPVVIVGAGAEPGAWKAAILTGNVEGGHQIGEYVVKRLNGEGKVVATNVPGIQDADERQKGWEEAFKGTKIEILDYQVGGTVESGTKAMENWLQKYGDEIDAVMGINDPTALGALTVIEEAGLEDKIFVVGVDGSDEAIAAMKACRSFGASAAQQPAQMGKLATETLYKVFAGEPVEKEVRIPTTAILREDNCKE
ncbi:MAG: sugar ABC transporter substrate-binding protein [Anaerolineae bacterium]|nr:sugar ABC transporter substrate-binding protein [Anaerolineae bacterium]